jgi:hypothetical protein
VRAARTASVNHQPESQASSERSRRKELIVGGARRALVRVIRYFVLKPAALVAWLAGLVLVVAVVVLAPAFLPSIPGVASLRGTSAPPATEDYLRGNRDYNAAIRQGVGRDEFKQIMARHLAIKDPEAYETMIPMGIDLNGRINVPSVRESLEMYRDGGMIPSGGEIDLRWIDQSLLEEAIRILDQAS